MYCKKCGKKLPDNSRFCDRCGQPVNSSARRNGTAQKRQVENRQHDSYDTYRKNKMRRETERKRAAKKRRFIILWLIVLSIVIAVLGGLIAYSWLTAELNGDSPLETPAVTESAEPARKTAEPVRDGEEETEKPDNTNEAPSGDYNIYIDRSYGFKLAYPASFEAGTLANSKTRLSLKDPDGDGEMLICYEKISESQTAASLLRDYVKGIGVEADYNRAGDDWYAVTFTRNGKVNHRKAIIVDKEQLIYYDFTYESLSDKRGKYVDYTDYIDKYMEGEEGEEETE